MKNILGSIKTKISHFLSGFKSLPVEKKTAYILACSLITATFFFAVYLIARYAGLILAILLILALCLLDRQTSSTTLPRISFYRDIEVVRQCCFDTLRSLSDLLGWVSPISASIIDVNGRPSADNIERYFFRVRKSSTDSCSLPLLEQRGIISEELNHNFLLNRPYFISEINGLYLDYIINKGTYIEMAVLPVKPSTCGYIQKQDEKYNLEYERSMAVRKPPVDTSSISLPHPYCRKDLWDTYNRRIFITQDMDKYPHILCYGSTGSGKTTAMKLITCHILIAYSGCELFLGDYKGLDYDFLAGCKKYFPHKDYAGAIQLFNDKLEARINGTDTSENRCLLVLDEWNNYLYSLSSKEATEATKKLSSILNMGRAYKMNVLIGSQTGHAEFFGKSRDSISTVLGLGQLSKEGITMFFRDYSDKIVPHQRGSGYLLQDGKPLREVIIPRIKNTEKMEKIFIERCNL